MEEWFPHLAQSGKTLMPVDGEKSHASMYIIICRVTTKQTIQGDILKNAIHKSRWNPKECSSNPKEGKRREAEKTNRQELIKWHT